jgi:predicted HTH domain antitoxin
MHAGVVIPDGVYDALELPEEERESSVRQELAASLSDRGVLSFGKARTLADLSKWEVRRLLGARVVTRHYTSAELDGDAEYARGRLEHVFNSDPRSAN